MLMLLFGCSSHVHGTKCNMMCMLDERISALLHNHDMQDVDCYTRCLFTSKLNNVCLKKELKKSHNVFETEVWVRNLKD